jgi:hypothetical protein
MISVEDMNTVVENLRAWVTHTDAIENTLKQLDMFSDVLHENNIRVADDAHIFLKGYDAATKTNNARNAGAEVSPYGIVESSVVWGVFNGEFMTNVLTASREYAQEIAKQQGGRVVAVALDPDALIPLTSKIPAYWDDGDQEAWPTRDQAVQWAQYGSVAPLYSGFSQKISQDKEDIPDVHF